MHANTVSVSTQTLEFEAEPVADIAPDICFHVTSTANKAHPQLAYLKVLLGASENEPAVRVRTLHDSGCAATIVSKKIFDQIPNSENIKLTDTPNVYVVSVTGEKSAVYGKATIYATFEGENGIDITFPLEVHIHDNIGHDFILGRDFTGSDAKLLETKSHLYLTDEEPSTDIEDFWNRAKHTACHVELISEHCVTHDVNILTTALIPPFTLCSIPCAYAPNQNIPIPEQKDKAVTFEIINIQQPKLKTPESVLYQYNDPNLIYIPVYNDTNNDYLIEANTTMAQIHLWNEDIPIHSIQISKMADLILLDAQNARLQDAQLINNDDNSTEEEKLENFYQYLEKGTYQKPMSTYVEDSPSVTEMVWKDIKVLTDEELKRQLDVTHLKPQTQSLAYRIFEKYIDVFSRHEYDLGRAKDIEMEIEIDETKPRIQKFIPLPHAARDPARRILDQMLEFGFIRECNEPSLFCSNLLVTKKKDPTQIRMLMDGRLLNHATIRLPMNTVTQLEVFAHMSGRKWITTADVSQAFFQVYLSKKAQPYTAFYSEAHGKRYCFKRCPQGLKNSPLYLKLVMDRILGDLAANVIHYVDDILIASDGTIEEHLELVGKVLHRLQEGGLKLRADKLHIATDRIEFLGIVWHKGILHIPEARVQAFVEYPQPRTPKQAKSFVCALSFYRRFIPRFAQLSREIYELSTLHPKQFKWETKHEIAFKKLIQAMVEHTSLNLPDPNKPFYVQTDASEYCGAGRVFQRDKDGNELLLACVSRTFTKTERKYGICRKETLALLYTLKSMDFFLRFAQKVIILVDAKSILFLRMCKESTGILLRFSLDISKYEAEIYHVPGQDNEISDILSREHKSLTQIIQSQKERHILTEQQTEQILNRLTIPDGRHFTKEEVRWLLEADSIENPLISEKRKKPASKAKAGVQTFKNNPATLGPRKVRLPAESLRRPGVILPTYSLKPVGPTTHTTYTDFQHATRLLTSGDITKKQLIQAQKDDPRLSQIIKKKTLPPYFLYIEDILYYSRYGQYRLALPEAFLDPMINAKHFTVFGLHFSKTRIYRDITTNFFVNTQKLIQKLQFLKENCILCQFNGSKPKSHLLHQSNLIYAPRVTWACDLIPSLPTSARGHNAMFLAVDMFTGYIQLAPLKSRQTSELIEAVQRTILTPFSIPKYFRCDSETGMFSSKDFYNFMQPLGIEFLPCSTGAPWSNGAAERAVQTVKLGVKKFVQQEHAQSNWDDYIHCYCASHNKSTSVYGYAPENLMFGFSNPSPIDLFQFWPNTSNQEDYMKLIVPLAEESRAKARKTQSETMNKVLTYRNVNKHKKAFKAGEIILQKQLQVATGPGKAMQPNYQGPYVIISVDPDLSSCIIEHLHTKEQTRAHFTNITLLNYYPSFHHFPERYDKQLLEFLPEKYSKEIYYPKRKQSKQVKEKSLTHIYRPPDSHNIYVDDEFINEPEIELDKINIGNKSQKDSKNLNDDLNLINFDSNLTSSQQHQQRSLNLKGSNDVRVNKECAHTQAQTDKTISVRESEFEPLSKEEIELYQLTKRNTELNRTTRFLDQNEQSRTKGLNNCPLSNLKGLKKDRPSSNSIKSKNRTNISTNIRKTCNSPSHSEEVTNKKAGVPNYDNYGSLNMSNYPSHKTLSNRNDSQNVKNDLRDFHNDELIDEFDSDLIDLTYTERNSQNKNVFQTKTDSLINANRDETLSHSQTHSQLSTHKQRRERNTEKSLTEAETEGDFNDAQISHFGSDNDVSHEPLRRSSRLKRPPDKYQS